MALGIVIAAAVVGGVLVLGCAGLAVWYIVQVIKILFGGVHGA